MNRSRAAYTLLELLIVMVILSILAAMVIPAVNGARSMMHRTSCQNHMRQVGMAFNRYAETAGGFPPVRTVGELSPASPAARKGRGLSSSPLPEHGWTYDLLPFLELQMIQDAFDTTKPYYDGVENQLMMRKRIEIFQCPATPEKNRLVELRDGSGQPVQSAFNSSETAKANVTDYFVHHGGVLLPDGRQGKNPLAEKNDKTAWSSFVNGVSKTILVDEMAGRPVLWRKGKRDTLTVNAYGTNEVESPECSAWAAVPSTKLTAWCEDGLQQASHNGSPKYFERVVNATNNGVYSFHIRGVNAVMADSTVRFISQDIVPEVYLSHSTREGDEAFSLSDFHTQTREELYRNRPQKNPFRSGP